MPSGRKLGWHEVLITQPVTTSHYFVPPRGKGLIRLFLGIEDAEDIIADLVSLRSDRIDLDVWVSLREAIEHYKRTRCTGLQTPSGNIQGTKVGKGAP
ncbi:MAG: hypothetical protein ACE5OY_08240 [Candidatus Bathyarchaeia archaeon]